MEQSGNWVAGFVVGSDQTQKGPIWKVRVKDKGSHLNGRKLVVASVHGGIELAPSLNVIFQIGSIGETGRSFRAVDVRLDDSGSKGE